jgi:hypothetical protein
MRMLFECTKNYYRFSIHMIIGLLLWLLITVMCTYIVTVLLIYSVIKISVLISLSKMGWNCSALHTLTKSTLHLTEAR